MRKFIIDTDAGRDDAVALIMALKSNDVKVEAYACTKEAPVYGQVIIHDGRKLAISDGYAGHTPNAVVCKSINNSLFKEKLIDILTV